MLQATSTTSANGAVRLRVVKSITPTVTTVSPSSFACQGGPGGANVISAITNSGTSPYAVGMTATVPSGLVAGNATMFYGINNSGSMVVEANP